MMRLRFLFACLLALVFSDSVLLAQPAATGLGEPRTISPHLVGYNNQMAPSPFPWSNPNRLAALEASRPAMLRYPGGTVATYWDFESGRLFNDAVVLDPDDVSPPRSFTQTQYTINWVAVTNGQANPVWNLGFAYDQVFGSDSGPMGVVFVLNMVTPGADYYALAWGRAVNQTPLSDDWWAMMEDRYRRNLVMLDEALAAGIPVQYIEFGNEYYFGASGTSANGATVEPYVAGVIPFDPNMVGAFPGNGATYAAVVNAWAPRLLERNPGVRLCAIGSDGGGSGRRQNWNAVVLSQIDPALVPAASFHLYGGVSAGNVTTTEANFGAALASWNNHWRNLVDSGRIPTDREAWYTEYNANVGASTWGLGLLSLHTVRTWLDEGNLGTALFHQFVNPIMQGNGPSLRATGRAFSTFNLAAKGRTRARVVHLADVPALEGSGSPGLPSLRAYVFDTGEGTVPTFAFVNFAGGEHSVNMENLPGVVGMAYTRSSAALAATADPGETVGTVDADFSLPAYSITVFDGSALLNDTVPPTIVGVSASPDTLWPANHRLVTVQVTASVTDAVDPAPTWRILGVASNQPADGSGDGATAVDWAPVDDHTVRLRAERSGALGDRVYTVTIEARDAAGNTTTAEVTVTVPHDRGR